MPEEREPAARGRVDEARVPTGERTDDGFQFAIESPGERVASEQLTPAIVNEHVRAVACVRHRRERLGIGIGDMRDIDRQRRDLRSRA